MMVVVVMDKWCDFNVPLGVKTPFPAGAAVVAALETV